MARPKLIFIAALIILNGVFYFPNLGATPLDDYDEATYAQVVKETLTNGNFLTFTYFGKTWVDKPPLHFWLMTASAKLFGLNEFALRLPAALFGIISSLLAFLIVQEIGDKNKNLLAFLAGAGTTLFPIFLAAGRDVRLEVPIAAAALGGFYFFIKGLKNSKFLSGVGICIGLGIMFKSIFGLLALVPIAIWSVLSRNWSWLKKRHFWIGIFLGALISLPWHIYEAAKIGAGFLQTYLGFHVAQRFTENVFNNQIGNWQYLSIFFKYGQPWSSLFLFSLALALLALVNKKFRAKAGDWLLPLSVTAFTVAVIFIGFMAVPSKLMTYLIPIYPWVVLAGVFAIPVIQKTFLFVPKMAAAVAVLMLAVSAYLSFSEVFLNPQLFTLEFSKDERDIGLYLSGSAGEEKIFSHGWPHQQTLRYYSGKEIDNLDGVGEVAVPLPFWLIIPNQLVEKYPLVQNFPHPYEGEYLTLVHFRKG